MNEVETRAEHLKVYTYGNGEKSIPEFQSVPLSQSDFLKNYHGYVAGKP